MEEMIKWLGHASVRIESDRVIYIDPWKIKSEKKADIILITHDHYDHCSPEDIEKIKKEDTVVVAARNCASKLKGEVKFVEKGEKFSEKGVVIEVLPAYNPTKNFHPPNYGGVGYIVETRGIRIYHTGDTDVIPEMKNLKVDVILVPVGGTYTMNAEEAAELVNLLQPKLAIPIHYGSIVGSAQDAERFKRLCKVEVKILPIST